MATLEPQPQTEAQAQAGGSSGGGGGGYGYVAGGYLGAMPLGATGEHKSKGGGYYVCKHCTSKLGFVQNMKLLSRFGAECLDCHVKSKNWEDVWEKIDQSAYFDDLDVSHSGAHSGGRSPELQRDLLAALAPPRPTRSDPSMYAPASDFREFTAHSPTSKAAPLAPLDDAPVRSTTTHTTCGGGSPCAGPPIARADQMLAKGSASLSPGFATRLEGQFGTSGHGNGAAPRGSPSALSPGLLSRLEAPAPRAAAPQFQSSQTQAQSQYSSQQNQPTSAGYQYQQGGQSRAMRPSGGAPPSQSSSQGVGNYLQGYTQGYIHPTEQSSSMGAAPRGSQEGPRRSAEMKPAGADASVASTGYSTASNAALGTGMQSGPAMSRGPAAGPALPTYGAYTYQPIDVTVSQTPAQGPQARRGSINAGGAPPRTSTGSAISATGRTAGMQQLGANIGQNACTAPSCSMADRGQAPSSPKGSGPGGRGQKRRGGRR